MGARDGPGLHFISWYSPPGGTPTAPPSGRVGARRDLRRRSRRRRTFSGRAIAATSKRRGRRAVRHPPAVVQTRDPATFDEVLHRPASTGRACDPEAPRMIGAARAAASSCTTCGPASAPPCRERKPLAVPLQAATPRCHPGSNNHDVPPQLDDSFTADGFVVPTLRRRSFGAVAEPCSGRTWRPRSAGRRSTTCSSRPTATRRARRELSDTAVRTASLIVDGGFPAAPGEIRGYVVDSVPPACSRASGSRQSPSTG